MPTRTPIPCRRLFLFAVGLTVLVAVAPVALAYKDAASTGYFLLHSLGFLISSRRAAVGTAG